MFFNKKINFLLVTQLLILFLVVGVYKVTNDDIMTCFSALAGGGVALINTLLMQFGFALAGRCQQAKQMVIIMYAFAGMRFVLVGLLFALLLWFKFQALAMVVSFAVMQLAYFLNLIKR